jgi:putative ABC transport system permease protein
MIGVGWGMFLYVSLLGAAKGMENGFDKVFSGFATNSIFLWAQNTNIPYEGFPKGRKVDLTLPDIQMLKNKISEIDYISPQNARGSFTGTAGEIMSRNGKNGTYSLTGDYPVGNKISEKKLIFGRYINDADVSGNKNVAVIGEEVYKNFFDSKKNENPIGKSINVKGLFFNVIGVFRVKKGGGFENDQTIFIPLSTYTKMYNAGDKIDMFAIVSKPNANVNEVEEKVKLALKAKNKVSPEDTNAFGSFNLGKEFKKLTGFLTGMQLLTIIVGSLTILAGVIAISNILLITVKERTKEIGIRRALGAKPAEVRNQILLESVVITLSSGLLGFMSGIFVLIILNMLTQNQDAFPFYNPTVNYLNVFGAMAVMVILGLLIGMIPAQRAVKIRPIEALRTE